MDTYVNNVQHVHEFMHALDALAIYLPMCKYMFTPTEAYMFACMHTHCAHVLTTYLDAFAHIGKKMHHSSTPMHI